MERGVWTFSGTHIPSVHFFKPNKGMITGSNYLQFLEPKNVFGILLEMHTSLEVGDFANLFWWVVSVVLFTPKLSIHLKPYIVKVNTSWDFVNVLLSNIICCMLPIHVL